MKQVLPFIAWRRRAYAASLALVVLFGLATLLRGGFNYGIDFVGGTSVIVKLDRTVDADLLAELRGYLEPIGLAGNIRAIGGGTASAEEAREVAINVRGTDWMERAADRFLEARAAGPLDVARIEALHAGTLEPAALRDLLAYFTPPADDTAAPAMHDPAAVTRGELIEIFQTIFNENIALSIRKVLAERLTPAEGIRRIDVNNVGNAENLAAALAAIRVEAVEARIVELTPAGVRPWKSVDEFLAALGLQAHAGPALRRRLSAETEPLGRAAVSILTASPADLAAAFQPIFVERFQRNAEIVTQRRDRDFGGIFPSVEEAARFVPRDDLEMQELLRRHAHAGRFIIASAETVGAAVGADLKRAALAAVVVSLIGLVLYIWFRFELRYGVGAIMATVHDTILTLGFIGAMGIEFNIPIVAALLTVIGYSVNDTIVIYDRIREKLGKLRAAPDPALIDLALAETLSRTILTSGTTLAAVLAFLALGPVVTRDLSLTLTFGILIGTFSSIFVAAPILIEWDRFLVRRKK